MQQENANKPGKKKEKVKSSKSNIMQNIFLVFIILFLTGLIVVGSIFVFNIGGGKQYIAKAISKVPIIGKLVKPVDENRTPEEIKKDELQAIIDDINLQTIQLQSTKNDLEKRESDILKKEEILKQKEEEVNKKLRDLSEKLTSIFEQVEYFEKMKPENATLILSNMESKGVVVQILRNMSKDKSSKILSLMDPLQAVQILEDIKEYDKLNYSILDE